MKSNLVIKMIVLSLIIVSCGKAKKELATNLINSYVQAVKEEDESMMFKIFPDLKYFEEYPKIDKVEIIEMKIDNEDVMITGVLFYETGFGKKIEQEIKFLINTTDTTISDVSGFLARKDRSIIMENGMFDTFPDLKPIESDMDVKFVKNKRIAWNRWNGFEYYAKKAIGERTKLVLNVSYNKYLQYRILDYYNKVKINFSITNNSGDTFKYSYNDDSFDYKYTLPIFKESEDKLFGCHGTFVVGPSETITQDYNFKGEFSSPLKKENIKIQPYISSVKEAMGIVEKYCNETEINTILSGEYDYWSESYNYTIKSE